MGLGEIITQETTIKVQKAKDPLSCVAVGTGSVLEDPKLMERISSIVAA